MTARGGTDDGVHPRTRDSSGGDMRYGTKHQVDLLQKALASKNALELYTGGMNM